MKKKRFPDLLIEPTTRCNLRCIMCFHSQMKIDPEDMEFSLYETIIEEASQNECHSIKFGYRGEPFLHPHLLKMIKFAKKKGIPNVIIVTNGTLLTPSMTRKLFQKGVDKLIFSVDSRKPEIYNTIRLGSNFYSVFSNISRAWTLRKLLNVKKPHVSIQGVKQELNEKEMNDGTFKNFWSLVADSVLIDHEVDYRDISPFHEDFLSMMKWSCFEPYTRVTILASGEIWLCCGAPTSLKRIGHVKDTILKTWNSPQMEKIRSFHDQNEWHAVVPCNGCNYARMDILRNNRVSKSLQDIIKIKQELKKVQK